VAASPAADLDALVEWALVPQFSGVDRTPFAGIEVLPPGGLLEIDRSGVRVSRWSRFVPAASSGGDAEAVLDDVMRSVFVGVSSVAASDHKTGIFLSGGFDSSLIAGVSSWALEETCAFTVQFEGQAGFDYARSAITFEDDTPYAQQVAEALELEHHLVPVRRETLALDLQHLAEIDDRVPAWEQELAQHHLARAASEQVKVVLVGDAADETHFGYHFLLDRSATASVDGLLTRLGAPARLAMLHPALREGRPLDALAARYRGVAEAAGQDWGGGEADVRATTALIVERWLGRLLHNGDVHTMAFGLEARVPFASNALLDLAQRVSPRLGLKDGIEKWHLRQAMGDELPEAVRWRRKSALPKDQGAEPVYRAEALRLLSEPEPLVAGLLDVPFLLGLARTGRPLSELERAMLFQSIALTHWARRYGVRTWRG
jgi:asparagine synthase (glutamine-hydrolysing)